MMNDHRVMDKFYNMYSMKDVERLGGSMTASLIQEKQHGTHLECSEDQVSDVVDELEYCSELGLESSIYTKR